ncbi:Bub3p [Sugiyamaella lignohabitans]|uniref:Bub3p n=1 Tax=Sugiyamaella lignohabitans TaxID=796027 RepID=A0A167DEQ7_9ASCO|nr:Bub3p [Sugiyamaella lignohabitans]ANB12832.1 Bub3p [Sugiyamaella lignohabitans]
MATTLANAPADLISKVQFTPAAGSNHLLVSSWDTTLRVYNAGSGPGSGHLLTSVKFQAPLLDCTWEKKGSSPSPIAFAGGLESRVYQVDLETSQKTIIGPDHQAAVKSIVYHEGTQTVISGSWDRSLHQTDPRTDRSISTSLPGKVFSMDSVDNYLVVAMSGREVRIYDIRSIQEPVQIRESSLKYPTRTVRCMPDGMGYVSTSIEGRVAVEFFDPSPQVQAQKYAFKCHRIVDRLAGIDTVTPVNSLSFHPKYGTFFTAGSDSTVCLWDYKAKKRLKQYQPLAHSVMSIDVNFDGTKLAIGTSDDSYKEAPLINGPQPAASSIYIRDLADSECRGRD